jgi:hypothetical protein
MTNTGSAGWRKSSWNTFNGNCVEVAWPAPRVVLVRDTKNRDGGTLRFAGGAWQAFTEAVKGGAFRGR